MTMVSSGPISLGGTATSGGLNQSVNVELGKAGNALITMNDTNARTLAGKPSGTISMSDFYGKSNGVIINLVISANSTTTYNIRNAAVAAYGGSPPAGTTVNVTINPGVYQGATTPASPSYTDNPGMRTGTGWAAGTTIRLLGSGWVVGYGGNPGLDAFYGRGANASGGGGGAYGGNGYKGGDAIWLEDANVTLNFTSFTGVIAGGGGGGGGGNAPNIGDGAGGGGGGAGYTSGGTSFYGGPTVGYKSGNYGGSGTSIAGGLLGGQGGLAGTNTFGTGGATGNAGWGVAGTAGINAANNNQAGSGGGGGGLGAAGGSGGDTFSGIGRTSGGAAGKSVRQIGGVGTLVGSPTRYGVFGGA